MVESPFRIMFLIAISLTLIITLTLSSIFFEKGYNLEIPAFKSDINTNKVENSNTILNSNTALTLLLPSIYGQSEFKEFKGDLVQLQYPPNWELDDNTGLIKSIEKGEERISFHIPDTEGAFTIMIRDAEKDTIEETLKDDINMNELLSSTLGTYDSDTLDVTDTTLSGIPAKKTIQDQKVFGEYNKILNILTLNDGKEYNVSYRMDIISFNEHLPTVEKVIESIKILE